MKKVLILLCLSLLVFNIGCAGQQTRPLIGITSLYNAATEDDTAASTSVSFAYIQAVADNGGTPVVLPTIDCEQILLHYVDELDGLVLIGGADIPPSAYGQKPHETVVIMPDSRYDFESRLIALWLDTHKPLLGICLGMQFTNVVSGGTMTQDIPSQIGTKVIHRGDDVYHWVSIEKSSHLAKILDTERAFVLSNHHQAVKNIGRDLKPIARTDDGVIEALERTDGGFGLFVQWHPEFMTADTTHRDAVYGAFVRSCAAKK